MLDDIKDAIWNLIVRGRLTGADGSRKMRTIQAETMAGDLRDDVEHFEPYGFTSEPKVGAEPIVLSLDGDREHSIAICVADRRYRLTGLKSGEVAVYDDLGQKVHLTRSGIEIETAKTLSITAAAGVKVTAPTAEFSGKVTVAGDIVGGAQIYDSTGKMQSIRDTYNSHTHNGGSSPDQKM